MKQILTITVLLALIFFSFIQKDRNKDIDKFVAAVDNNVKTKKLIPKQLNYMSRLGGAVTGYYSGKQLQLIQTTYAGDVGYTSFDFYISSDTLIFVKERIQFAKIPTDQNKYEVYIKSHTDKDGNVDMTKLLLEKSDYNIYYIDNNIIVDFSLKSFGKPKKAFEDDIARKNKEIIEHYKSHLEELKE